MLKTDFPATLWKVHATLVVAACAVALSSPAHASGWPVFDGANFLKNAISAAQALKTEVYENTNIIYQYKMMLNQLQQAVGLDDVKNQAQIDSIQADVKRYSDYGQVLEQLYGAVSNDSSFLDRVNGLVVQSGKSPAQWFEDQRTLLTSGNKTAQALFNAGTDVSKNVARLAQRRQDLQSQMTLSPTAQATAQTTNRAAAAHSESCSDELFSIDGADSHCPARLPSGAIDRRNGPSRCHLPGDDTHNADPHRFNGHGRR
ncbi:conjugal transfer protein TrbJ [Ralstonia solanacearum]|uniref:conjugal transfer protein TrbJ n=1 Tax=Ralstonia solanacearum TaxID=305 RepID=UPI000B17A912|nr:conjugal transfer protein TrbJ [Ralstonia solanacearum]